MTQHRRKRTFAITILCVLMYAFIFSTAVVFADESPPPVTTEETTEPPADETSNGPAAENEEVEASETDTADSTPDVPAASDGSSDEPAEQASGPENEAETDPDAAASEDELALEQLPADTTVVVVVDDQIEPLVTQEAADALELGDPIWCPAGEKPGYAGCTTSYTSLTALLTDLKALNGGTGVDQDGTIWIEDSYDSSVNDVATGNFVLNGTTLTTWADNAITFQGGWDGAFDSAGTIVSGGVSDFSAPLRIVNWNEAVSVNDITLSNRTGNGLTVTTTGDININNVTSSKNANGHGAVLSNKSGTSGNIKVTASSFNGNSRSGLVANSNGDISLKDVTGDSNGEHGASLNNRDGSGTITLTGVNSFNDNTLNGLRIISAGSISNSGDLTATDNLRHGVFINNSFGTGDVKLTGNNLFTGNTLDGLRIISAGNISSAGDLTAKDNRYGIYLDNTAGTGYVKLEGTNTFSDNRRDGIYIKSNGDITVKNATASTNKQNGFNLETTNGTTALWCGVSENNGAYGVNVTLNKKLYLFGMAFSGNALGDVNVDGGSVLYGNCSGNLAKSPGCDTGPKSEQKLGINVVSVTGAQEQVGLSCQFYTGTKLILPNGDYVFIPCPIGKTASLEALSDGTQALPDGTTFGSGLTLEIAPSVDGLITISFMIPENKMGADLAILFWNGSEWVEVNNAKKKDDRFEARVARAGTYVLVSK